MFLLSACLIMYEYHREKLHVNHFWEVKGSSGFCNNDYALTCTCEVPIFNVKNEFEGVPE